jgi:hypothetical protein
MAILRASDIEEIEARLSSLQAEIDSLTDELVEANQENDLLRLQVIQMMSDRSLAV